MKIANRILLIALFSFCLVGQSFAQSGKVKKERASVEERATMQTERMAKHLDLTEEQKAQVYEINLNSNKEMDAAMDPNREIVEELHLKRRELNKARREEIKNVLTEEQIAKLDERKGGKRGGHGKGDPSARIEKRLGHLTETLDLTADQQEKIRAIMTESAAEAEAILEANGAEEMHAELKEIRKRTKKDIKNELTPEQVETFKSMREEKEGRGPRGKHLGPPPVER